MIDLPDIVRPYLVPLLERKPTSVSAIDVSQLTSYADILIIVGAGSPRQATSLAEHLVTRLKGDGILPLGTEGVKEGEWALLDYGDIIIHVFDSKTLSFYDLEGFWSDAPRLPLPRTADHSASTDDPTTGEKS